MKFSLIASALCTFVAVSRAVPIGVSYSNDLDLVERDFDDYEVDAREWDDMVDMYEREWEDEVVDFFARAGFANAGGNGKKAATAFVNQAKAGGQLAQAAAPGTSAKTVMTNNAFHLDRQQPSNAQGQYKFAVQLNHVKAGAPSTVGQVAIHGTSNPNTGKVAHALNHSIRTGKETHINHPNSKGAQNVAANAAAQNAKAIRLAQAQRAGDRKAAAGTFKKGNK